MSLLDNFPHECTIQKLTRTADTKGGSKDSFVDVATGVKCWEQDASSSTNNEYAKRGITNTKEIYFTTDRGLTERHQIKVTKKDGVVVSNPTTFEVLSEADPDVSAGLGVLYSVVVRALSGESQ